MDLDQDFCLELFEEIVLEQGKKVFSSNWDSSGPGAGADSEVIYSFRDYYWPMSSTLGLTGPCETLKEALRSDCGFVTQATKRISCTELSADKLAKLLTVTGPSDQSFDVTINGETWRVGKNRKLDRVP